MMGQWWCAPGWGRPVNDGQARRAVTGWLRTDARPLETPLGREVAGVEVIRGEGLAVCYAVRLRPTGWVLVAADDEIEPIIAFSANEDLDISEATPLGNLVRRDVRRRLARRSEPGDREGPAVAARRTPREKWDHLAIRGEGDDSTATLLGASTISDMRVPPLLAVRWGQGDVCGQACFNYYTPNQYRAGCVATAMAQVMRYYQHPTAGIGRRSFEIRIDGQIWTGVTIGGDGSGGPYLWSLMSETPDCSTTPQQRQAIGAICYDAGVSVGMKYTAADSTTDTLKAADALTGTFGFARAVRGYNGGSDIGAGLVVMLNPNLDAGAPVILGVVGASGHAVVCDGYGYSEGTLYHHLNMGWNGWRDAWYNLPNIDSEPSYSSVHKCVYNIQTTAAGEIVSGRVLDAGGQPLANAQVYASQAVKGATSPMTAVTDARGIYAFAFLKSGTSYSITPFVDGHQFGGAVVKTGVSLNDRAVSGNYWGLDFTGSPLSITGITPSSGPSCSSLRIQGVNFGVLPGAVQFLGGGAAEIISWSNTTIYCRVPAGTVSGDVHVETAELHRSTGKYFRVTNPNFLLADVNGGFANMENGTAPYPFRTVQQAVDAAGDGDSVLVAPGIYRENIRFRGRNIIVRSLEPENEMYVSTTVLDGRGAGPTVTFDGGEGADCRLSGFTITGGSAANGGGVLCVGAGPTITRCVIAQNTASTSGGGLFNTNSATPVVSDCRFIGNAAAYGGGAANSASDAWFDRCEWVGNTATREGGAMHNNGGNTRVRDCLFNGNHCSDDGGAVSNNADMTVLVGCVFNGNTAADRGGALFNKSSQSYTVRSRFIGNCAGDKGGAVANYNGVPAVVGCVLAANRATGDGGAIYSSNLAQPLVVGCTICGNEARGKGGGIFNYGSTPTVRNTILWANVDAYGVGEAAQYQGSIGSIQYSCVQGWTGALGGAANTGADPLLVSLPRDGGDGFGVGGNDHAGNLRLSTGSPCIDAADKGVLEAAGAVLAARGLPDVLARDVDGMPRCLDTPAAADTGTGTAPFADIGAYEFTSLIAHWKFDEAVGAIAGDSAGDNNGWLSGPRWQPGGGRFGGALRFDGVNDQVAILTEEPFDLTEAITVSAWVYYEGLSHEYQTIIAKGDSAWRLSFYQNEPIAHFAVTAGPPWYHVNSSVELASRRWYHLCGTFDGEYLRLYIDGQLDPAGPVALACKISVNDRPVRIGENVEKPGRFWNGLLDDVRVYNYPLDATQVRRLLCEHPSVADLNGDCLVNMADLAILSRQWLEGLPGLPGQSGDIAPEGGDGRVDSADLAMLAQNWLRGGK